MSPADGIRCVVRRSVCAHLRRGRVLVEHMVAAREHTCTHELMRCSELFSIYDGLFKLHMIATYNNCTHRPFTKIGPLGSDSHPAYGGCDIK